MTEFSVKTKESSTLGWKSLAASVAIVGLLWLVVLPAIENLPAVAEHVTYQQEHEINPSAMYYTDLGNASELTGRIERMSVEDPESFWKTSK